MMENLIMDKMWWQSTIMLKVLNGHCPEIGVNAINMTAKYRCCKNTTGEN